MNEDNKAVNKRDVKEIASFVLLQALKLVVLTKKTSVEILIDVMVAAALKNTSVEQVCKEHEKFPSGKTVRTHISEQLQSLEDVETRLNRGLRNRIPKIFRRKEIIVAIDYVEVEYYGEANSESETRKTCPKNGTSSFHTYATAYAVSKGERYTLAITYVRASDSKLEVIRRLNKRLNQLAIRVECYLLDRQFYSVEIISWFMKYNKAFIMPVVAKGKKAKGNKPATGSRRLKEMKVSQWQVYTMTNSSGDQVTFDAAICCTNYNGKHKKKGRRTFVYATYGLKQRSLQWIKDTYRSRFGIESSYRQMRNVRIKTSTTDPLIRYLYIGIALILRNIWVWLHWSIFSLKRRGLRGRTIRLFLFSLDYFKSWISSVISDLYGFIEQISIDAPLPPEILRFRGLRCVPESEP